MATHSDPDAQLMLRVKGGDLAAFEELVERYKQPVINLIHRNLKDATEAEDLAQNVFVQVYKSASRYKATAKFSTFLFRVAHNCFIDHVRRNKRHTAETNIDPDLSPNPGEAPEQLVERHLARRRLDESLQLIPSEQRDVFLLYEEAGLSIDEIARVTGVNRETAKSRLRYAVGKLKASLAEPDLPDGEQRA